MSDQELSSSSLSAALSHLAEQQTSSGTAADSVVRPSSRHPTRLTLDPGLWNLSLKSSDQLISNWFSPTGSTMASQSGPQLNVTVSSPQTPSDGYATMSIYPSTCTSPEYSPRKHDATGSEPMWSMFFGNDYNANESGMFGVNRSQAQSSQMMGQVNELNQETGYGYWSDGQMSQQPPAAVRSQANATLWSSASPYSLFGNSQQVNSAPPGYAAAAAANTVNQSQAWNSRSTGVVAGYGMTRQQQQPDYLTGSGINDYSSGVNDIAVLEEQFRDFKLKPQILTDQYRQSRDAAAASRKNRSRNRRPTSVQCVFCLSNGEDEKVYKSHVLKDPIGRVVCPVLRLYCCPVCNNKGGDFAHTIKYCPRNKPVYKFLTTSGKRGLTDMSINSRFQSPVMSRK